ncbi:DUF2059 domain-containing protein [bacterium]|jgi:hypothetical protein|nr:DUF2059 domain-containing protein [bacterium]
MIRILILFIILSPISQAQRNRSSDSLDRLIDLIVDKETVQILEKDFYIRIESGLNLTNRAIFEELLLDGGIKNDEELMQKYESLEQAMNTRLRKSFEEKLDFIGIFRLTSREVYSRNYSKKEIRKLTAFFSTPVGKKYLSKSQVMIEESQMSLSKALSEIAIRLAEPMQDAMQEQVIKILKEADE